MRKLVAILLLLPLWACESEAERQAASEQEQAIDRYIVNQMAADTTIVLVAAQNTYRLIMQKGEAPAVARGDSVSFLYTGYIFSNGKGAAFDSNKDTLGFSSAVNNGKGIAGVGHYIRGLDNGLVGMEAGEKAQIIFAASQGFENNSVGIVPPLSPLLYEVEIVEVKK